MRFDAIGMFWEDRPATRGRNQVAREMPAIPDTGWKPPQDFPDLSMAPAIAIDTETWDPELTDHKNDAGESVKAKGPGWARNRGHVVGVSIAVPDGRSWYYPVRHEVERDYNIDPEKVFSWLRAILSTNCPKIGANLLYDVGWLRHEGVKVNGPLYDIQYAEALLNSETPDVSLEALAHTYLGMGKETSILYQWCADYYGGAANDRQRANIYRSPPRLAGPYAEADATLPLRIMEIQWPLLVARGVMPLFEMECGLIRLMMEMRYKGAPVDIGRAEQMFDDLTTDVKAIGDEIKRLVGFEVNPYASASMAKAFDALGLPYKYTASGNPTFTAAFLEKVDHPIAKMVVEQKQKTKLRDTFVKGYILDSHVNGRVHCQFHQLRGDENGARSGRFSSSTPNLQNIPIRTEIGKMLRKAFVSLCKQWRKYDYSQIEYRLLAHHAVGQGAEEIRQRYNANPHTDYHDETIELLKTLAGLEIERRPAKTINFGLIYGMSRGELIHRIGSDGAKVYEAYHRAVPFARETAHATSDEAQQLGYITTILGRRSDFPFWVPQRFDPDAAALPFDEALLQYGSIQRAYTHKALNRRLQGGAADIMKAAMLKCYADGIFDETGFPLLTVHDELDFDDEGASEEAWGELKHVLETCVQTRVPLIADLSIGPSWGEAD